MRPDTGDGKPRGILHVTRLHGGVEGKMQEDMGYQNVGRVYELSESGRLTKPRGGKLTVDTMALNTLLFMAHSTYDWPPSERMTANMIPARLYTLGWRGIAKALGMTLLSFEQLQSGEDPEAMMKTRETTAKNRISQTWKDLAERGLIKQLYPQSLGKNAGYLLLIGDPAENREVEAWARRCLGLPQH